MTTPRDSKYRLPSEPGPMEITPDMARDWLDHRNASGRNRSVGKAVVARYADAMRRGDWKETHQGIAFDTEGEMLDGQHRLQAISDSNATVPMWVFPNMPRDTFDALDVGRKRAAAQLLTMPYRLSIAGGVRYLAVADGIHPPRYPGSAVADLSNVEVVDIVRKAGYLLEDAARQADVLRRGVRIPPSPVVAVLYQGLHSAGTEKVAEFVDGVATGAGLERNDARLRLRNAFNAPPAVRASAVRTPSHPYALLVKAWNHFLQNKPMHQLMWRGDEDVPKLAGYTPTLKD